MIQLDPSNWYVARQHCGCLIGMGIAASGVQFEVREDADPQDGLSTEEILSVFPWLRTEAPVEKIPKKIFGPLAGWAGGSGLYPNCFASIISVMAHMVYRRQMTLEEAVDWIRSVEPQDDQTDVGQGPERAVLEVQAV
jgi:hypothetical protein